MVAICSQLPDYGGTVTWTTPRLPPLVAEGWRVDSPWNGTWKAPLMVPGDLASLDIFPPFLL